MKPDAITGLETAQRLEQDRWNEHQNRKLSESETLKGGRREKGNDEKGDRRREAQSISCSKFVVKGTGKKKTSTGLPSGTVAPHHNLNP
jgi:hypothetical protein